MSNTSTLNGLFKEVYDTGSDVLVHQQNLKAKTWGKIKKSPYKPSADGVFSPVSMSGNENGSAINENQGFQQPGSLNPIQTRIKAKLIVWPFEVTGSAMRLSESDPQAFARSLDAQMQDNTSRMMSDINRQALGVGTGQMSLVNDAVVNSANIVVDQITPFRRGQHLDIYATIGGAKEASDVVVTAVNYATSTITVDQNVTVSDNAVIVKYTVQDGAPADGKELSGLRLIADNGTFAATFEGVSVTTNPEWAGNVIDAGTAPISQDLLQRTAYRQDVVGGTDCDMLISNVGQARNFLNTELNKVRYEAAEVKAGHEILKWNDKEWIIEKDYEFGEVGMYCSDHIEKFEVEDIKLADLDGSTVDRIHGFDKVAGYYVYQGNLGTWKRNAHAKLINLTEPAF